MSTLLKVNDLLLSQTKNFLHSEEAFNSWGMGIILGITRCKKFRLNVVSMLSDIGLILADTSRSRAYLAALERNKILPSWVLLPDDGSIADKTGKVDCDTFLGEDGHNFDDCWSELLFNPSKPLKPWLDELGLDYQLSKSKDINSDKVIRLISEYQPSVMIYSGYGGVLLHKNLLSCGKSFCMFMADIFLIIREVQRTTTVIEDSSMGASSIFLTEKIDCGPILKRRKFSPPQDCSQIDHIYDSAARAFVLVETLRDYLNHGKWNLTSEYNNGGTVYYIIHPILKHLAILNASRT